MTAAATTPKILGAQTITRRETNLWTDAFYRLIRNKGALVGGVIILVLFIVYIFAPVIAPRSYEIQISEDNSAMPAWLISLFPSTQEYARVNNSYPLGADNLGRDRKSTRLNSSH